MRFNIPLLEPYLRKNKKGSAVSLSSQKAIAPLFTSTETLCTVVPTVKLHQPREQTHVQAFAFPTPLLKLWQVLELLGHKRSKCPKILHWPYRCFNKHDCFPLLYVGQILFWGGRKKQTAVVRVICAPKKRRSCSFSQMWLNLLRRQEDAPSTSSAQLHCPLGNTTLKKKKNLSNLLQNKTTWLNGAYRGRQVGISCQVGTPFFWQERTRTASGLATGPSLPPDTHYSLTVLPNGACRSTHRPINIYRLHSSAWASSGYFLERKNKNKKKPQELNWSEW